MGNKKNLLANCIISNRRLEKDLISYLNSHKLSSFLDLMQTEEISFPLSLTGSINGLKVIDSSNNCFVLCLAQTCYLFRKFDNERVSDFLFSLSNFSVVKCEFFLKHFSSQIIIDKNNDFAEISIDYKDTLRISFDETVSKSDIIPEEMLKLCVKALKYYLKAGEFNIKDIELHLSKALGDNYTLTVNPIVYEDLDDLDEYYDLDDELLFI